MPLDEYWAEFDKELDEFVPLYRRRELRKKLSIGMGGLDTEEAVTDFNQAGRRRLGQIERERKPLLEKMKQRRVDPEAAFLELERYTGEHPGSPIDPAQSIAPTNEPEPSFLDSLLGRTYTDQKLAQGEDILDRIPEGFDYEALEQKEALPLSPSEPVRSSAQSLGTAAPKQTDISHTRALDQIVADIAENALSGNYNVLGAGLETIGEAAKGAPAALKHLNTMGKSIERLFGLPEDVINAPAPIGEGLARIGQKGMDVISDIQNSLSSVQEYRKSMQEGKESFPTKVLGQLGPTLAAMGLSAVGGPGLAGAYFYGINAESVEQEALESGASPEEANKVAGALAPVIALLEETGLGAITRKVPAARVFVKSLLDYGEATLMEGTTEVLQDVVSKIGAEWGTKPAEENSAEFAARMSGQIPKLFEGGWETFKISAAIGGGMHGIHSRLAGKGKIKTLDEESFNPQAQDVRPDTESIDVSSDLESPINPVALAGAPIPQQKTDTLKEMPAEVPDLPEVIETNEIPPEFKQEEFDALFPVEPQEELPDATPVLPKEVLIRREQEEKVTSPTPVPEELIKPKALKKKTAKKEGQASLSKFVRKEGGLNYDAEALKGELDRFSRKEGIHGIVRKNKTGRTIDEMLSRAKEEGYFPEDARPSDFLEALEADLKGKKAFSSAKEFTEASLPQEKEAPTPDAEMIPAGDLEVGDKYTRAGEKFEVKKENEDGTVTIADGETFKVDPFDMIPVDEGKIQKAEKETLKKEAPLTEEAFALAAQKEPKAKKKGPEQVPLFKGKDARPDFPPHKRAAGTPVEPGTFMQPLEDTSKQISLPEEKAYLKETMAPIKLDLREFKTEAEATGYLEGKIKRLESTKGMKAASERARKQLANLQKTYREAVATPTPEEKIAPPQTAPKKGLSEIEELEQHPAYKEETREGRILRAMAADKRKESPSEAKEGKQAPLGDIKAEGLKGQTARVAGPGEETKAPLPEDKPTPKFGGKNKVFTEEKANAARERIRKRLNQMNVGIDPEMLKDGIELGGYYIEGGARSFSDFSKKMVADFGEKVKQYLKYIYRDVRDYPEQGFDPKGMDVDEAIDKSALVANNEKKKPEPAIKKKQEAPDELSSTRKTSPSALEGIPTRNVLSPGEVGQARIGTQQSGKLNTGRTLGADTGTRPALRSGVGVGERKPHPASPGKKKSRVASKRTGLDYTIRPKVDLLEEGGPKAKYQNNLNALKLLKKIESEGRKASKAEQAVLVKYAGWGGISQAFEPFNRSWKQEHAALKNTLTKEEYESARRSSFDSFYTPPQVISGVYKALSRVGFKGGRVLEPSVGTGHFFGMMPKGLASNSHKTGIELDPVSGRIASQLYQGADVRIEGFETSRIPENFYDVALGNVPFGDYKLNDPKYNKHNLLVHDYFFVKAMDKVRPGGVMAFITSSGSMNKKNPRMRKMLSEKANFLGAIRLPDSAFKKIAGTTVTSDIIFLRKLMPGEKPGGVPWIKAVGRSFGGNEPTGSFNNEYFVKNKDMMLGRLEEDSFRPGRYVLKDDGRDLSQALEAAIKKLPRNAMKAFVAPKSTTSKGLAESIPSPEFVKPGAYAIKDGKLLMDDQGNLKPPLNGTGKPLTGSSLKRAEGLIEIRDIVRRVLSSQVESNSDTEIKEWRQKLNSAYDKFVKKHGFINAQPNNLAFRNDPDYFSTLAPLEVWNSERKTAAKADIFKKRTIGKAERVEKADTAKGALLVSLAEKNKIDFARMQELYGLPENEIKAELKGLIYENPEGSWETADQYLSGDVKAKLEAAEGAARFNPAYKENVVALKDVQPIDLQPADITIRPGASWLEPIDMQGFLTHLLRRNFKADYNHALASWSLQPILSYSEKSGAQAMKGSVLATETWGTKRANAFDLFKKIIAGKEVKVYSKLADGRSVVNRTETEKAKEKAERIKEEFQNWILKDERRAARLVQTYNDKFNNFVQRKFDGAHLTFPGMSPSIKLTPHQVNAVWRILQNGNTLLAHVVGAGKTFEMIAAGMEARRLGLSKKPTYVVPNHLVGEWATQFKLLYPASNILVPSKEDYSKDNRAKLMGRIATGDWDAVIIPHSSFTRLPVSDAGVLLFMKKELNILEDALTVEGQDRTSIKDIEKAKRNLETKIKKKEEGLKGLNRGEVSFEETGIDMLFVDEADMFKNLYFPTKMTRVSGLASTESARAFDMHMKTSLINTMTDERGVVFATGTPVSNTLAEIFTMQRYLQPKILEKQGLESFDAWASNYATSETKIELAPDGSGFKNKTRFTKFTNVPELLGTLNNVMDLKNAKMLNLPTPKLKGDKPTIITSEASSELMAYVDILIQRGQAITSKMVDPSEDNWLKITGDGRKAALDIRLVEPSASEDKNSKVNKATKRITEIWQEWDEKKGTQLVFLDMSTPKKGDAKKTKGQIEEFEDDTRDVEFEEEATLRSSVYSDIKEKLIAQGIPEKEVAFIHDANTDIRKERLFEKVNTGEIRVLIGSTEKMGAGTNVQKKLVALHHIDAPWRPRDLEQREGRIIRQGNEFYNADKEGFEVEIVRYATEAPSFDVYMWQTLEAKAKMINQAMSGEAVSREIDDLDDFSLSSVSEMKAIISGNPIIMEKADLDSKLRRLRALKKAHVNSKFSLTRTKRALSEGTQRDQRSIDRLEKDIAHRDKSKGDDFSITINQETFTKRGEADAFLKDLADSNNAVEGELQGFHLSRIESEDQDTRYRLTGPGKTYLDTGGSTESLTIRLSNLLRSMDKRLSGASARLEEGLLQIKDTEAESGKAFKQEAELQNALKRDREINAILSGEVKEQKARDDKAVEALKSKERGSSQSKGESATLTVKESEEEYDPKDRRKAQAAAKIAIKELGQPQVQSIGMHFGRKVDQGLPGEFGKDRPKAKVIRRGASLSEEGIKPNLEDKGGVTTLALGIRRDLIKTGRIDLRGRSASSAEELAIHAQVFRDPRFETFRIFYTKASKIVGHEGLTSRLPASSAAFFLKNRKKVERLEAAHKAGELSEADFRHQLSLALKEDTTRIQGSMSRLEADGYYLLHNHPSGIPTPSQADVSSTRIWASALPGFQGHIVINSGQFSVIDKSFGTSTKSIPKSGKDLLLSAEIPHSLLSQSIGSAGELVALGKQLQVRDGFVVLTYTSQGRVRAIQEVPLALYKHKKGIQDHIRGAKRAFGATDVFSVYEGREDISGESRRLIQEAVITDSVVSSGVSLREKHRIQPDQKEDASRVIKVREEETTRQEQAEALVGEKPTRRVIGEDFDIHPETILEASRRTIQDRLIRLKVIQEEIQEQGGKLTDEMNAYQKEELMTGRARDKIDKVWDRFVEPLVKKLHDSGLTIKELERFVYAKHAPERNAQIEKVNPSKFPNLLSSGSGMTDQKAAKILADFETAGKTKKLTESAKKFYEISNFTKRIITNYGLESQETIDKWDATYKNYVPLRGTDKETTRGFGIGKGLDIRGRESQRAKGRTTEARDIFAYTVAAAETAIIRAEKNRVGRAFLKFASENPAPKLWKISKIKLTTRFDKNGEVVSAPDPRYKFNDNVLSVKVNGEQFLIEILDEGLAKGMKGLSNERQNLLVSASGVITRYQSMAHTALNPEFVISNFMRDIQTAAIHLSAEQSAKMAAKVVKDTPAAIRGAYRAMRGKKDNEWSRVYKQYKEDGGEVGFFGMEDISKKANRLQALVNKHNKGVKSGTINALNGLKDVVMATNGAVENGVRLAAYKHALDSGMSRDQAASLAKNLTVNFNRKGTASSTINSLYMFFNAQVQGNARMFLSLHKSKRARKIALGIMVSGFLSATVNRMMDDDEYEKVENYEKETHMIIMGEDGAYVKWMLPHGYNLFWYSGVLMSDLANGRPGGEVFGAWANAAINTFNPIGGDTSLAQLLSPTVTDPFIQVGENKNFFGGQIYPKPPSYAPKKPDSQMYWNSVRPISKDIVQGVNRATGGDEVDPGGIDVSPESLDHVFDSIVGGAGAFTSRTANYIASKVQGKDVEARQVPFYRKFAGQVRSEYDRYKFRENYDKVLNVRKQIKEYLAPEDATRLEIFKKRHQKEIAVFAQGASANKSIRRLNREKRRVIKSKALPEENKESQVKRIEARIKDIATGFNRLYDQKKSVALPDSRSRKSLSNQNIMALP